MTSALLLCSANSHVSTMYIYVYTCHLVTPINRCPSKIGPSSQVHLVYDCVSILPPTSSTLLLILIQKVNSRSVHKGYFTTGSSSLAFHHLNHPLMIRAIIFDAVTIIWQTYHNSFCFHIDGESEYKFNIK